METFWNGNAVAFFRGPSVAKINVKYGNGGFGVNRQSQTLKGPDYMHLSVGSGSLAVARMRLRLPATRDITFDVYTSD